MAYHVLLAFEGLGADIAGEEPFIAVHVFLVDLQVAAVSEGLLAGVTFVRNLFLDAMTHAGNNDRRNRLHEYGMLLLFFHGVTVVGHIGC